MVVGFSGSAIKMVDIITDILIFIQGLYGVASSNRTTSKISSLINLTLVFTVTHIVAIVLKLIISAGYVDNYNWENIEDDENMSDDESQFIEMQQEFVYSIII